MSEATHRIYRAVAEYTLLGGADTVFLPVNGRMLRGKEKKQRKITKSQKKTSLLVKKTFKNLHMSEKCSTFVRSVLRNGETDGQAVRTGEFGGTSAAMQGNGVFDNRQT